jgi:hypothetical protein
MLLVDQSVWAANELQGEHRLQVASRPQVALRRAAEHPLPVAKPTQLQLQSLVARRLRVVRQPPAESRQQPEARAQPVESPAQAVPGLRVAQQTAVQLKRAAQKMAVQQRPVEPQTAVQQR